MSKLVTIYGGSGFVGRYIARRIAKEGWRVRVAVRNPNEAMFVKPYGAVGQIEPILCNIRDDASVLAAMAGADVVVNCVGVLAPRGKNTFDAVQHEGAERISRLAAQSGVDRMVHISAIGADHDSDSAYSRTKALGEEGVLLNMPNAMILRPSVVFGPEDEFFNRFAGMAGLGPVVPIVSPGTKFQPVYVDDVAQAAVKGILGTVPGGTYELGGPDVRTFKQLMETMLETIQRRRLILGLPAFVGRIMGFAFDMAHKVSLGLIPAAITRDQVKNLAKDNVVSAGAKGFADVGIRPTPLMTVLPDYLWRFRPSGQYAAIKASAKNLR